MSRPWFRDHHPASQRRRDFAPPTHHLPLAQLLLMAVIGAVIYWLLL